MTIDIPDFINVEKIYLGRGSWKSYWIAKTKGVIIIILRFCDWYKTPLDELNILPKKGEPVSFCKDKDEAWYNVVQDIEKLIP